MNGIVNRMGVVGWAVVVLAGAAWGGAAWGQDPAADPTAETNVIKETLAKIREIEQLDKYVAENSTLKDANKQLQQQVTQLQQQVTKLTQELQQENERLRKQLLQMPTFEVKSKIVVGEVDAAVLQSGDRHYRIRRDMELSVPVADGVWVLMRVEKITKELIQLHFPELERTIYLYD